MGRHMVKFLVHPLVLIPMVISVTSNLMAYIRYEIHERNEEKIAS